MAPKRKDAEGQEGKPKKKAQTDLPSFDSRWQAQKPSLLFLGDDLEPAEKIAAFDLDGTLIEWKSSAAPFSLEPGSWEWYSKAVPRKLKELSDDKYKIVIFTNQAMIKSALTGKAATNFKAKVDSILKAADVSAVVCAATQKDENRKPGTGMWDHFISTCNGGKAVDVETSFFVGDAAGRSFDIAATDKEFAAAVKLPFKTPEEMFGDSPRPNKCMAAWFRKLAKEASESSEPSAGFKRNALNKAAAALESHAEKIESGKQAMKLSGVGKGSVALIDEYLETGIMGGRGKAEKAGKEKEGEEEEGAEGGSAAAPKRPKAGLAFLD